MWETQFADLSELKPWTVYDVWCTRNPDAKLRMEAFGPAKDTHTTLSAFRTAQISDLRFQRMQQGVSIPDPHW